MRYIGLDVHRRQIEVCILDENGGIVKRVQVATTKPALVAFAQNDLERADHLALEATTNCWAVVYVLRPYVGRIAVSNPMATKLIAQSRVKTDKVDAWVLAQLLRTGFLPEVWCPDQETIRNRRLTHRRTALTAEATAIKNRVHAILSMELVPPFEGDLFGVDGQAWLGQVELGADGRAAVESELRLLKATEEERKALEEVLAKLSYAKDQVRLLMTIPGVDYVVAFSLLAALGDIRRFKDGDRVASYLGISPRTRQSGDHCYHGPITKAGNSHARWMLIQAAWTVERQPGPLAAFFTKVAKRRGRNIAVVAVARKLAVIAWHMLTKNEPYRYAVPSTMAAKLGRLRIRATGKVLPRRKAGGQEDGVHECGGQSSQYVPGTLEICKREGLPAPKPIVSLPAGEIRVLKETGTLEIVTARQQSCRRPRPTKKKRAG